MKTYSTVYSFSSLKDTANISYIGVDKLRLASKSPSIYKVLEMFFTIFETSIE